MRQLAALENKRHSQKTITYILTSVGVVEEAIIGGRSVGQVHAKLELKTFTEDVSA